MGSTNPLFRSDSVCPPSAALAARADDAEFLGARLYRLCAEVSGELVGYEAILASLAILVWHFYWVIFDPDVYPMDWTWWDGHPPNQRVVERLPAEYDGETKPEKE